MLTPLEQFLQIIAWLLALLEVSVALYILALNVRHPANRHISALLLLFAVNGFAVGQLLGARGIESARMPTIHLAAAAPVIAPGQLITMLILLKPEWLKKRRPRLKAILYLMILLPAFLLLSDLLRGAQFFYSDLDPLTYTGGYVSLRGYLQGWLGGLIRILYTNVLHILPLFVLIYVAFWDQQITQSRRSLARLLLAMNLVVIAVMLGGRREAFRVPGLLLGQAITATVYTYAGFKQMISRRRVKRGHLQNRIMLLLLAVAVPLIVGIVIFIVKEVDSLLGQILIQRSISAEGAAVMLEGFKRTIWLVSMGAFLLVMAFVWLTVRQTLRPIRDLTDIARAITAGDLTRTVSEDRSDEVDTLARAFNTMTARLRALIDELESRVAERTEALEVALNESRALYRVSDALMASSDLDTVLQAVVDTVAETLPASTVLLITFDQEAEEIVDYVSNQDKGVAVVPTLYEDLMEGLTGWVVRNGQPALSPQGDRDPRESTLVWERRCNHQVGAIIVVPLRYQEETFGTLTAINQMDEPDFTERHVELMVALAGQAAAVVRNARLFEQTRRALRESQALSRVGQVLLRTKQSEDVLQKAADAVAETLEADRIYILTMDLAQKRILYQTKGGPEQRAFVPITFEEAMEGLIGWVAREGKPALSPKGRPDPREGLQVRQRRKALDAGPVMIVPLQYGRQFLGTMVAVNRQDQPDFTRYDLRRFSLMANQVAAAVDNARLFDKTQQSLAKTEALYRVARSAISLESLDDKLQTVADQVSLSLPADRVLLITLDLEDERIVRHVTGGHGEKVSRVPFAQLMEGLTGWVIRERKPALSPKGKPDPREGPAARQTRVASGAGAILVVPMVYQEEILGTLTAINRPDQRDFTGEDAELMLTMVNQAAIAIKNAQLVENLEAEVAARTAEIRAEQEKTEAILQSAGDAIVMVGTNLRIRYVNRAFLELTDYRSEEILGQRATILLENAFEDLHQFWPSIRRALVLRKIWQGEAVICRADGTPFDAALTIAAMRDGVGRLIGYVTSHRDITEAKRLKKARHDFLVNVSHQLRTPVTTIQLYLELAQQTPDAAKLAEYLQNAAQETSELAHLVEDMLMVTELDSGDVATVWKEVSMVSIAQDVVTHYLPLIEKKAITMVAELPDTEVPMAYGDSVQLHRAVAEVVENAVHFTPAGGKITIAVEKSRQGTNHWVDLTVEDSGPGITPREQEYLFERFYRGRLAESGHIPGSGLGLVIAKGIIEAHGGELQLLESSHKGAKFLIRLRAKEVET